MAYETLITDLRRLQRDIAEATVNPKIDSRRIARAIEALNQADQVLATARREAFNDGWERGRMRDITEPTVEELEERETDRTDWEASAPTR